MSLCSQLLVYSYYGEYNMPHERYGKSYHLYRIVHEHITNTYVNKTSCVRRDIETARRLNNGEFSFDDARQQLDLEEIAKRLATWYHTGKIKGFCSEVESVLAEINRHAPLETRAQAGASIFALDSFEFPPNITDSLQIIMGKFMHFVRGYALARVSNVFDPTIKLDGWWYNKFCVLTYMYRIIRNTVPAELTTRLQDVVTKYIKPEYDESNNALAINNVYGRFCGIGKDHFVQHKMSSVYIFFRYMRGEMTHADERFSCFSVIKDFGRQCKETYTDLQLQIDTLYIYAMTDKQKNALFDLLCCNNASDIDVDCYDYIVKKFYNIAVY
ncbi:hypothetical protein [Condylorrhiza vestigialis mutiple nucleopolyhedrovirus]|uniref:Uncharacterized protein n=1 Tax=Condylorrhiza vestigialis mutiple nucleopolyhedrovirus TaxID=1592576 RepID=A0A0B4ULF6_9ABAC|nr:hypothetical protein [Condylorrhiza vestigialis mutiple nucleopolyhedrovirus]AJD09296.1 hypothetical protein [Condylorrhiza vestigialis mutiple nucleopolyhedrovirus]